MMTDAAELSLFPENADYNRAVQGVQASGLALDLPKQRTWAALSVAGQTLVTDNEGVTHKINSQIVPPAGLNEMQQIALIELFMCLRDNARNLLKGFSDEYGTAEEADVDAKTSVDLVSKDLTEDAIDTVSTIIQWQMKHGFEKDEPKWNPELLRLLHAFSGHLELCVADPAQKQQVNLMKMAMQFKLRSLHNIDVEDGSDDEESQD